VTAAGENRQPGGTAAAIDKDGHIARYRQRLVETRAYEREMQIRLKRRVFDTFDQLLRHTGRPGLSAGTSLLDLGAADGSFVDCCIDSGLEARGIDIDDGINLEDTPFPVGDGSVDVVTANSVIEHLLSPENILSESLRTLKPGGALILVTPNWRFSVREFYDDPTHVRPYTQESISELLRMYGYEDIRVYPWIVKKPAAMWELPLAFHIARFLPFRGDAPSWIPELLKGRSKVMLIVGSKPAVPALSSRS
jgi:SAM-dependent methyltransferase